MVCCSRRNTGISLAVIGAILLTIGLTLGLVVNWLVQSEVKDQLPLTSTDAILYEQWQSNSKAPIYMTYFMFHVVNPEGAAVGDPIVLEERGPYVYNEFKVKFNITWNDNKTLVTFRQHETFVFNAELSAPNTESDEITTVNFALYTALMTFESLIHVINKEVSDIIVALLDDALLVANPSETMFITKTVGQLLWGYTDALLNELHFLAKQVVPSPIVALQVNNTPSDWVNTSIVYTGADNVNNVLTYLRWDGYTEKLDHNFWGSEYANMINGTDATQFQPDIKDDTVLPVFVDSLYRSARLLYAGYDVEVKGITLKRFILDPTLLQNATLNPDSAAFFSFGPSGVLNLTQVSNGTGVFISKPHFLDADPVYRAPFYGLNPIREQHDTFVDVEPITGATMQANKRLQINIKVAPQVKYRHLSNIPNCIFPIFYVNESGVIPDDLASDFRASVYEPIEISNGARWASVALGSLFLAIVTGMIVVHVRNRYKLRSDEEERQRLIFSQNEAIGINIPSLKGKTQR